MSVEGVPLEVRPSYGMLPPFDGVSLKNSYMCLLRGYTPYAWKVGSGPLFSLVYSGFSYDVTKIQTQKLSILLSFYFHEVLQHLKTYKFPVRKGALFCDRKRFCVTQHFAGGRESSCMG